MKALRVQSCLVCLCAFAAGCGTVLSTQRPANVVKEGSLQASLGLGISIPVTAMLDAVDQAKDAALATAGGEALDDAAVRASMEAALLLATNPPLPTWDLHFAYGLWANLLEVNARMTTSSFRLGSRFQVLDSADVGVDLSVGVGATVFTTPTPLEVIESLELGSSERIAFDFPVLAGWSWEFGHAWAGPKVVILQHSLDFQFDTGRLPADAESGAIPPQNASLSGQQVYVGAQVGGALGFRYAWFTAEMTVMHVMGDATYSVGVGDEEVAGALNPSGWVLAPSFGVLARY